MSTYIHFQRLVHTPDGSVFIGRKAQGSGYLPRKGEYVRFEDEDHPHNFATVEEVIQRVFAGQGLQGWVAIPVVILDDIELDQPLEDVFEKWFVLEDPYEVEFES